MSDSEGDRISFGGWARSAGWKRRAGKGSHAGYLLPIAIFFSFLWMAENGLTSFSFQWPKVAWFYSVPHGQKWPDFILFQWPNNGLISCLSHVRNWMCISFSCLKSAKLHHFLMLKKKKSGQIWISFSCSSGLILYLRLMANFGQLGASWNGLCLLSYGIQKGSCFTSENGLIWPASSYIF